MEKYEFLAAYIFLLIISIIINKKIFKKIILPSTIYTFIWCFCGISAMFNSLELIKPSNEIHLYIILSIIVFNLVYCIFSYKDKDNKFDIKKYESAINYKLLYFFNFIALIAIFPSILTAINVFFNLGFDLSAIRNQVYLGLSNSGDNFTIFFNRNIPDAIIFVTLLISAVELVLRKKTMIPIAIIDIVVGTVTFGGRNYILGFIVFYCASFIILNNKINLNFKKKYIIIGIILLIILTSLRTSDGTSFINTIILYFSGSLSFLEYILQNPNTYGLNDNLLFGYLTFSFIIEPIILIIKLIFEFDIRVPSYFFNIRAQNFANISEYGYRLYNNNTTIFYIFLMDFGKIGIVIGTFFIATVIIRTEKLFYKNGNIFNLFILIYMYWVLITSSISYKLLGSTVSIMMILLYLCTKNKKRVL